MFDVQVAGSGEQQLTLDLPPEAEIPTGAVIEVELRADRVTLAPDSYILRSLYLKRIEQGV